MISFTSMPDGVIRVISALDMLCKQCGNDRTVSIGTDGYVTFYCRYCREVVCQYAERWPV